MHDSKKEDACTCECKGCLEGDCENCTCKSCDCEGCDCQKKFEPGSD